MIRAVVAPSLPYLAAALIFAALLYDNLARPGMLPPSVEMPLRIVGFALIVLGYWLDARRVRPAPPST